MSDAIFKKLYMFQDLKKKKQCLIWNMTLNVDY